MKLTATPDVFCASLLKPRFDHPVLNALPVEVRLGICERAENLYLPEDVAPPRGRLYFLKSGVLGIFPAGNPVCAGTIVPGSVYGWEALLDENAVAGTRAIVPSDGFSVPLSTIRSLLGETWIFRFLAAHAVARTRVTGIEAACNARHTASQRTAKWIMRLHQAVRDPNGISITQARLADLLGFQRTSINASCGHLRDRGAIRIRRGRLIVSDVHALEEIACKCDSELVEGRMEREPARLAH